MERPIVLELRNVSIGYRNPPSGKEVLSGVDLKAYEGQLISLMGANGTGKSTLLRTTSGILPVIQGEILINGRSSAHLSPREIATQLSVVLTDKLQAGYMTVWDLVAMGRYPYTDWRGGLQKQDLEATTDAIEITGLAPLRNEYLHTLSDGQMQKAMIARALAQDGNLMMLDEPLIHLDIPSKWEIMELLKQMARHKKKTVILATHELDLSLQKADLVWLINKDRRINVGTPEELSNNGTIEAAFSTLHFEFKLNRS